ncbi:oligosaccharide flippase family protein [uncultured Cloacibacillus sp.]|uniref:lipopolysaccharide biosynthesis protein n=1 Tax=uncultured Cloacibacillus sp. TaxID=889794 RepID=UPI00261D40A2|nr:oligosaccharide flippase family protein [uncultured Cloacibacillus sp.]
MIMTENNSFKALKAGIWYTFSNFLSKGLVFITTSIFARVLTKTEYGEYTNFATWQSLLLVIATFDLYSTIPRARYDYENEIDQYISSIMLLGTIITFGFYVFAIIFMPEVSNILKIEPRYIHVMFLYILVAPAIQTYQAKCRIFLEYKTASALTIMSSVASVLFAVLLVVLLDDKLFGRIIGQQAILIIVNLALYFWIIYKGRSFNKKFLSYSLRIAFPLVPHIVAGNLFVSFDKIAINQICGPEDLAYYSLAFNCALLVTVLWSSLNQAMVPWLFENLAKGNLCSIKDISKYYIGIFMFISAGILLMAPEIVFIFGGNEYERAKYLIPPVIMGACFQFAYSMYVNIEMYKKKTILISIGTIAATFLNILLNYIFINIYGYVSAAYTTMFCFAVLAVFHFMIVKKMKMSYIYDNKFNSQVLLLMTVVTLLVNFTYQIFLIRLIAITFYVLIAVIFFLKKRKKLCCTLNMIIRK